MITGISGMLGSNMGLLMNKEYSTIGSYNSKITNLNYLKTIKLDIRNKRECQNKIRKINPDVVVHCAAITDLELCEKNKDLAYDVNTVGTENVLEATSQKCHFIFISTDNIYCNGIKLNNEDADKKPRNIYGYSKLNAEKIILDSKKKSTILRTNIFGWHLLNKNKGLLSFIYNHLNNKKTITLFNDVFFTPISIPNFIKGIKVIIDNTITGTFNFAGQERLSKLEFGNKIADFYAFDKKLIVPISIDEKEFIASRPKEMSINSNKIAKYVKIPKTVYDQVIELDLPNY